MRFMFMLLLLSCQIVSFPDLQAQSNDNQFVVSLDTESAVTPLYLLPIVSLDSDVPSSYKQEIEKILAFDLNHNGCTFVVQQNEEALLLAQQDPLHHIGDPSTWKAHSIYYVVKPQIEQHAISCLILDVAKQSLKKIDPLPLVGDVKEDRRQIHRLSDMIVKALFGKEGIATTRILYTVKKSMSAQNMEAIAEVWEVDYDGGNPRQLTDEKALCVTPIYLPPKPGFTAGGFAYVSYETGQPKIYISSLKDGKKQRLSLIRGSQMMPAISLQRDKIAFICDITGNPDLFLQPFSPEKGVTDKPQQIFASKRATQGSPTFSPDGKRIAFVSNKEGSPKIYVMKIPEPGTNIQNLNPILITKANRENSAPSWSPDGTKLAYCAKGRDDRQIWVYDFDTQQERQITKGQGNKENPSWAPNSQHLVFNSSDPRSNQLFILNIQQCEPIQITFGEGEKRFPNWEPRLKM